MTRATMAPEDEAAAKYMAHKGYPTIEPLEVDRVQGETCWYYLYELPEGLLELEVDFRDGEWEFATFWVDSR